MGSKLIGQAVALQVCRRVVSIAFTSQHSDATAECPQPNSVNLGYGGSH